MTTPFHASIVIISQILFNIFKTLEIKYTYENKINKVMINSIYLNLVSLVSTYYAINDLLKGNIIIILFYIFGSVLGKWFGMKIKIKS